MVNISTKPNSLGMFTKVKARQMHSHTDIDGVLLYSIPLHQVTRDNKFSHVRLRKPTGSLVLDRSIRDNDLAQGIRALSCKSKQRNASPIVCIVSLRR